MCSTMIYFLNDDDFLQSAMKYDQIFILVDGNLSYNRGKYLKRRLRLTRFHLEFLIQLRNTIGLHVCYMCALAYFSG
jgi:hypothetical protein